MRLATACVLLLSASIATTAAAQRRSDTPLTPQKTAAEIIFRDVVWGLKAGLASPGTAWIDNDIEIDIDGGYSLSAFVDYRLGPKILGTAALNVASLSGDVDSDMLRDLALLIKAQVGDADKSQFLFRPAVGFGYGSDGESTYLMMHALVEMVPIRSAVPWVLDVGMFTAPVGGNDDFDVALEPRLVLRFGRLF